MILFCVLVKKKNKHRKNRVTRNYYNKGYYLFKFVLTKTFREYAYFLNFLFFLNTTGARQLIIFVYSCVWKTRLQFWHYSVPVDDKVALIIQLSKITTTLTTVTDPKLQQRKTTAIAILIKKKGKTVIQMHRKLSK